MLATKPVRSIPCSLVNLARSRLESDFVLKPFIYETYIQEVKGSTYVELLQNTTSPKSGYG